jgi:hypothetical protein
VACCGVILGHLTSQGHRTSNPRKTALPSQKQAPRPVFLCFHETCANPSDTEKVRRLLASLRVASKLEDRIARSRKRAWLRNRTEAARVDRSRLSRRTGTSAKRPF